MLVIVNSQKKCRDKVNDIVKKGVTLLFVSHSENTVKEFCDRAIYLNNGKIISQGKVKDVFRDYK